MKLGEQIYRCRKQAKLSQEELAERIGVSRQAVSKWERNEAAPDVEKLMALARVFGVTVDQLLQPEEPEAPREAPPAQEPMGEEQVSRSQGDSLDRMGGFLERMIRRYGWLFGVYVSLSGLGIAFIGGLARAAAGSMVSKADRMMGAMGGLGGGWVYSGPPELEAEVMDRLGVAAASPAAGMAKPFLLVSGAILVLGLAIAAAGAVLAVVLYRKGRR